MRIVKNSKNLISLSLCCARLLFSFLSLFFSTASIFPGVVVFMIVLSYKALNGYPIAVLRILCN